MQGIGVVDGVGAHKFAPIHAVDRLNQGVNADQHRGHGGNFGRAVGNHQAQKDHPKTQQVGPAIAQENFAPGPIPHQKAQRGPSAEQAPAKHHGVFGQPGQARNAGQKGHHAARGQTMKSVNDVDGIDKTCNDQGGQQKSRKGQGQKQVNDVYVGAHDTQLKHHIHHRRGGQSHQQAHIGRYLVGQVFHQAANEHRRAGQHDPSTQPTVLGEVRVRDPKAEQHPDKNGHATQTRGGLGMEFLHPRALVHAPMPMRTDPYQQAGSQHRSGQSCQRGDPIQRVERHHGVQLQMALTMCHADKYYR